MNPVASLRRWSRRSLLRRLWLWTTLIVRLVGASTAAVSYLLGYIEANRLQDTQLRQVAALVHAGGQLPDATLLARAAERDQDARIVVQRLGVPGGLALPPRLAPGMHVVRAAGEQWRVFVRADPAGAIAAAQRTDLRSDADADSALRTLYPLLALIPLLALLAAWVVRRALDPVLRLAAQVDARSELRLDPLPMREVPRELVPFVESINRLLERVSALRERERRFVADAAHELRTPIAALTLQAENLSHVELAPQARERLRGMLAGLARTRAAVEQLLSLARAQSGRFGAPQRVEPSSVLRHVLEDLLPLAEQRGIDLGIDHNDGRTILAAPTQLYTLLRNAVDNALRYTPRGGRVDLGCHSTRDADGTCWTHLQVEDDGPGIDASWLERAFEPFNRLQRDGDEAGTGLGLTIMSHIASNLGGRLLLENRAAGGLRVRYSQRCAPDAAAGTSQRSKGSSASESTQPSSASDDSRPNSPE